MDKAEAELLAKHVEKIRELRFSDQIKLVRRSRYDGPSGWMLFLEGVAGGHAMNFGDGFLYHTQGRTASGHDLDVFKSPNFYTNDVADAIHQAEALTENLNGRRFIEFEQGFITKFLNPESFERQRNHWMENYDVEVTSR